MKVEIYPTLGEALEKLEKGEALKTSSAALVSPVKVRYERTPLGYENVEIAKPGYYDEPVYYECLLFRKDKLKEINEDLNYLVELVERKGNLFERPIRELIAEGIKEISSLKKEFICLGEVQLRKKYVVGWETWVQDYRKELLTTMEESGWKKELLYDELKKLIEREIKRTDIEIVRDGRAKISIVDKEIGEKVKRIVADYWEEGKILGLDGSSDDKVMLNKILSEVERKFGKKYLESIFPNVIGKIPLHLKDLESVVFIPLTIDREQSREVIKFLTLTKQKVKVEAGSFEWSVIGKNEDLRAEIPSSYIPITLINQEEVPKEIMETAKEEGKKTILIRSDIQEDLKIIRKYFGNRKFREKDQEVSIDEVYYGAEIKNLVKSLVIDVEVEGSPKVFIEKINDRKEKVKEEIYLSIQTRRRLHYFLKSIAKEMENIVKGLGYLGEIIGESIKEEIEKMERELKEREEKENNQDNVTILKTVRFVLERVLEILKNGENVKSKSYLGSDYCLYRLYPMATKGYTPIIETEKGDLAWNRVGFQSPEIVKGIEKAVDIINSKGLDKLCFNSKEGKKEVKITEIGDKDSKELLYIRSLTDRLVKAFGKYFIQEMIDKEKEKYKARRTKNLKNLKMEEVLEKEVRDVNKLALLLSGAVISSMKKFPKDMELTMRIMKNIYNRILLALTMGAYTYEEGEIKKRGNMALNWKELTKSILGVVVDLHIKEEITTEIPGEKEREIKRIEKKIEVGRSYNEGLLLYVDSGIKGKVILIETPGW
jgi:hypothetical protein